MANEPVKTEKLEAGNIVVHKMNMNLPMEIKKADNAYNVDVNVINQSTGIVERHSFPLEDLRFAAKDWQMLQSKIKEEMINKAKEEAPKDKEPTDEEILNTAVNKKK